MHILVFEIAHFDLFVCVCVCALYAIFLFLEERDIKGKRKYIFTLEFNGGG